VTMTVLVAIGFFPGLDCPPLINMVQVRLRD
jgi:hypothetical protein